MAAVLTPPSLEQGSAFHASTCFPGHMFDIWLVFASAARSPCNVPGRCEVHFSTIGTRTPTSGQVAHHDRLPEAGSRRVTTNAAHPTWAGQLLTRSGKSLDNQQTLAESPPSP